MLESFRRILSKVTHSSSFCDKLLSYCILTGLVFDDVTVSAGTCPFAISRTRAGHHDPDHSASISIPTYKSSPSDDFIHKHVYFATLFDCPDGTAKMDGGKLDAWVSHATNYSGTLGGGFTQASRKLERQIREIAWLISIGYHLFT